MLTALKEWARAIKRDVVALWLAARDPRTPWYAKAVAVGVAAYALSPIDLIPDFVPVFGYLDDVIVVPAGIWLAIRLIPAEVLAECRIKAMALSVRPYSRAAPAIFVVIWVTLTVISGWFAYRLVSG